MRNRAVRNSLVFLSLELKMLRRNKKPLNNLLQIILVYIFSVGAFFFILKHSLVNTLPFLMIISLMSSSYILGYGVYFLTWESTYFSFFMTRPILLQTFFLAKFITFIFSVIFLTLINIPLLIWLNGDFLLYFSFLIFNLGILPIIIASISFLNNERASLSKGIFFNYEGYGLWQYLIFLFEVLLPGIIYLWISKFRSMQFACIVLVSIGILGVIYFIKNPILFFKSRKYRIIYGFNRK
jgi:hypothetical protein